MVLRTAIPTLYVLFLASVEHLAGTGWAGLMSTFPSMSLVVLLVTYLEAGPAQSSRIALVLPAGNTSTAAFLAAFRFACPQVGLSWGTVVGYAAALFTLLVIEGIARRPDLFQPGAWAERPEMATEQHPLEDRDPRRLRDRQCCTGTPTLAPERLERSHPPEDAPPRRILAAGRNLGLVSKGFLPFHPGSRRLTEV